MCLLCYVGTEVCGHPVMCRLRHEASKTMEMEKPDASVAVSPESLGSESGLEVSFSLIRATPRCDLKQ